MNILVLMLQSVRRDTNHGGSSKVAKDVCGMLGERGHDVTLLCSSAADNHEPYVLAQNVHVAPELPFRESWQDTWLVPPADLATIITTTIDHAADADRIVIFDAHFLYPDVLPSDVPTIWSLRDFVYVQALQGSMGFRRDRLVAPSAFVRDAFTDATRSWLPGIDDRVLTIGNGVDLDGFRPVDPASMRAELGFGDEPTLLFPHRPEEEKGLGAALEVCGRLARTDVPNVRLVIPRGTDVTTRPTVREFYAALEARVEGLGLAPNVVFCDWVTPDRMPELYAAASLTLCLGDIVEACSNVALESLACGTPVAASAVACFREYPQDVHKVAVGDVRQAEVVARSVLQGNDRLDVGGVRKRLGQSHAKAGMLEAFRQVIVDSTVMPPLQVRPPIVDMVKIPAWVSRQGDSLYDEYRKAFVPDGVLRRAWRAYGRFPFEARAVMGDAEVRDLLRAGLLVAAS